MMTRNLLIAVSAAVLIAGGCSLASSQHKTVPRAAKPTIMRYAIRLVDVPVDTVLLKDSAHVKVEMYLDCTNKITRTETLFDDTTAGLKRVMLAVYGTYVSGPYRPMCAARRFVKEMLIRFPAPGDWIVETRGPEGSSERDSSRVIFVR